LQELADLVVEREQIVELQEEEVPYDVHAGGQRED
jgi:hypothetical protein